MLNFIEISQIIENPSTIKLEDLEGIRQLAERYPFTGVFSQLYLKGLALHNTIQFEAELKNHAYKIPDRSQLFYLVHSVEEDVDQTEPVIESYKEEAIDVNDLDKLDEETPTELVPVVIPEVEIPKVEQSKEEFPIQEQYGNQEDQEEQVEVSETVSDQESFTHDAGEVSIGELVVESIGEVADSESVEKVSVPVEEEVEVDETMLSHNDQYSEKTKVNEINSEEKLEIAPIDTEIVSNDKNTDDTIDDSDNDTINEESEEERKKFENISDKIRNVSDLDRDILAHAISSAIFIEIDELEADTYHFEKLKKIDRSQNREEDYDSAEIEFDLPLNDEFENDSGANSEDNFEDVSGADVESNLVEADLNLKPEDVSEPEIRKTFTSWMSSSFSDAQPQKEVEKTVEIPQLEKKAPEKPEVKEKNKEILTPEKRKSEFFSPIKKARESLDESRLPVSETLAKVYAAQGNYPKAIEAYEKLLLKFPEKKSFFALQIETLNRKLN